MRPKSSTDRPPTDHCLCSTALTNQNVDPCGTGCNNSRNAKASGMVSGKGSTKALDIFHFQKAKLAKKCSNQWLCAKLTAAGSFMFSSSSPELLVSTSFCLPHFGRSPRNTVHISAGLHLVALVVNLRAKSSQDRTDLAVHFIQGRDPRPLGDDQIQWLTLQRPHPLCLQSNRCRVFHIMKLQKL